MVTDNYEAVYLDTFIRLNNNKELAEDLTNDAIIKIMDALRNGKYKEIGEGTIVAWMLAITRNLTIDYLRINSRIPLSQIEVKSENGTEYERTDLREYYYSNSELTQEETIVHKDQIRYLRKIVRSLPFKQREVFILRNRFKYSFIEIAERTGVSINTALGRMRYSLQNIRKELGKDPILELKKSSPLKGVKTCTKCDKEKSKNDFNKESRNKKSGLSAWCSDCVSEYSRLRRTRLKQAS